MPTISAVVAEVYLTRTGSSVAWRASLPSRPCDDRTGLCSTATEAVWRAVDSIRVDSLSGTLAVHSLSGDRVAYVPLWAVPAYDRMQWIPTVIDVIAL